jgi:ABC-2 type transport system ATP-binding protein
MSTDTNTSAKMSPGQPIVEVRNLCRSFGKIDAVRDLSFTIMPGQVVGFIGANGAGKTTTMRMMATLELPTSGSIRIGGYDVVNHPGKVRQLLGWMPDAYGTYDNMTVIEYLDFYARAFGYTKAERRHRVEEVMEFANLTELSDRAINKLSKGMAQRLCLGRTLLHDPELLILDEPAAGLDPKARIEFKHLVRLLAAEGKTLFISSHILSELGEMCDSLLFIDSGQVVHHGSADSLLRERRDAADAATVEVRLAVDDEAVRASLVDWVPLQRGASVLEATRLGLKVRIEPDTPEAMAAFLKKLIQDGFAVAEFRREERRLEEAFVEILGKRDTASAVAQPSIAS